jgi:hypothetical protein
MTKVKLLHTTMKNVKSTKSAKVVRTYNDRTKFKN